MSKKLVACLIAIAPVIALGVVASPAHAQDDADEKEEKVDPYAELQRANKLASYNALTRSIPHYKKVVEAAPRQFPIAHFNLGEVYRVKGECGPAVLYFEAYLRVGKDKGAIEDAKKAIDECKNGKETVTLNVKTAPRDTTRILIGGAIFSEEGEVDGLELLPGEYEIAADAIDHLPASKTVTLDKGADETVELDLVHKTYFGTLKVEVDQKGAKVEVEPLELDAPESEDTPEDLAFTVESPMEEERTLPTGKYSIEVNKDGFNRWIRYVRVDRDELRTVSVEMIRALPSEIR
jgi:tetratricopeptide (TPR) repeat protein